MWALMLSLVCFNMPLLKKAFNLVVFLSTWCLLSSDLMAQGNTIVYLNPLEDAVTTLQFPNTNWGQHNQLSVYAWTQGGTFCLHRSYLKFNLLNLPTQGPLISAKLHLFYYDPINLTQSGQNAFRVALSNGRWFEDSITWNNQPTPSQSIFVDVPSSTGNQNFALDVTDMVRYSINNNVNNGFILHLIEEQLYRMVLFGSRENEGVVPFLELEFLDPGILCDTLRGPLQLTFTNYSYGNPNSNQLDPTVVQLERFDHAGINVRRSYLKPNLNLLPPSINLHYANLELKTLIQHTQANYGNNALEMFPFNQSVNPATLTWNNSPTYNPFVRAEAGNTDLFASGVALDVLPLLAHSYQTGQFNGYVLKLVDETDTAMAHFGGTTHLDPRVHPELVVCYSVNTSFSALEASVRSKLYPNPATDYVQLELQLQRSAVVQLRVLDLNGKVVLPVISRQMEAGVTKLRLDTHGLAAALYTLEIGTNSGSRHEKLLIVR